MIFFITLPLMKSMSRKLTDSLHAALTNQFVILAVAILLFLLVIICTDSGSEQIGELWI